MEMNRAHGLFADDSWRRTVIQLYSFSKSYAIPGHRTGAITADSALIAQVSKILDCIQICPPRTAQAVLPWAIDNLRSWREENRHNINHRAQVFRQALAPLPEWRIESAGAYFAYLTHPFEGRSAQQVAEKLATERGVLVLPGSYFGPGTGAATARGFRQCGSGYPHRPHQAAAGIFRLTRVDAPASATYPAGALGEDAPDRYSRVKPVSGADAKD